MDDESKKVSAALGDLQTGVEEIDREHAYLFSLENRLTLAFQSDGNPGDAAAVFNELLEYMAEHFRHEEALMTCLPVDTALKHKEQHAEISGRLIRSIGRPNVPARFPIDPRELVEIVATWLQNHIRHWDMPLAAKIQAKRRSASEAQVRRPIG